MAKPKTLGQLVREVHTCMGDEEVNEYLKMGWVPYGSPCIPVGHQEFHWAMVLKREEEE